MGPTDALLGLGLYTALLAVILCGFWVYGVVADRLHARRMVRAFDAYVALLDKRRGRG
jgi:hypothetical protein